MDLKNLQVCLTFVNVGEYRQHWKTQSGEALLVTNQPGLGSKSVGQDFEIKYIGPRLARNQNLNFKINTFRLAQLIEAPFLLS